MSVTFTVADAASLEAAFAAASDGDRIELLAGDYDATQLQGRTFSQAVTITSADPQARAVFTDQLVISEVTGLVVTGVDVTAAALASRTHYPRIALQDAHSVTLQDIEVTGHIPDSSEGRDPDASGVGRGSTIAGYGYDLGISVKDSSVVTLDEVTVADMRTTISMNNADFVTMTGLDLSASREGINMSDVSDVVIADSYFHDFLPWKPGNGKDDHPDMIQYWGTNGVRGVHNLTIRDNLFYQPESLPHTQTIFGSMRRTADESATATNFTVTGNTIFNGHLNAIALYDVQGALIEDNVLLPHTTETDTPRQVETPGIVLVGAIDAVVTANTLIPYANTRKTVKASVDQLDNGEVTVLDDNVLLSEDPNDPLFWRNFLWLADPDTDTGSTDTGSTDTDTGSTDTDTDTGSTDTGSTDTDTGSTDTGSTDTDTGSTDTDTGSTDTQLAIMIGGESFDFDVVDHLVEKQGTGDHAVSADGSTISITNNGWKAVDLGITVAAGSSTVLSFDFQAFSEGELHAIGFARGDTMNSKALFQLWGIESVGQQAFNGLYAAGDGTVHYDIPVGDYLTRDYWRLVLVMDDDRGVGGDSSFANIEIL